MKPIAYHHVSLVSLLLALASQTPAQAAPNGHGADGRIKARVAIVTMGNCCPQEAWPSAERRISAELRTLGLVVIGVRGAVNVLGERARRLELMAVARRLKATAALRIVRLGTPHRGVVQIWLVDRATGKTTLRDVAIGARSASTVALVALRVVELLRASLLELQVRAGARPGERPSPRVTRVLHRAHFQLPKPLVRLLRAESKSGPWSIRLGVGALGEPADNIVRATVHVAVGWQPHPHLTLELSTSFAAIGDDITYHDVESTFDLLSLDAWIRWEPLTRGRWRPSLGAGAGTFLVWSRGHGSPELNPRSEFAAVADVAATAQLALVLTRTLWLRLAAVVGVALPHINIRYGDDVVATFGRPYISGSLGLEVRLP